MGKVFPVLTTLDAPQALVADTDQPAAPHAALYALVDHPRRHWLRLDRRWLAEAVVAAVALTLAISAFALAGHF
ncbi:hypothetical protein [Kribbella lupini]|uniref:Uncharacterized protein n=1 Tax=Kribbella lupini TaxID=291602 RepID=A0ABP4LQK0_9ACTN